MKVEQKIEKYYAYGSESLDNALKEMERKIGLGWRIAAMTCTPDTNTNFPLLIVVYEREIEEKTNNNNIE